MSPHFSRIRLNASALTRFPSCLLPLLLVLQGLLCLSQVRAETITIESDQQLADNGTGVVTARGNVRLVHPGRGVVATSRQAQYFTREERVVLSGDVDVVQEDGTSLRAEQVTYLLKEQRTLAKPLDGRQVLSSWPLPEREAP